MLWRAGVSSPHAFPLQELSEHLNDKDAVFWVDLCDPERALLDELASELSGDQKGVDAAFKGRAIEEAVELKRDQKSRPRASRHVSHTFVTVYATRWKTDSTGQVGSLDSRLEASPVFTWVLPRGIVTVHRGQALDVDGLIARWQTDVHLLSLGVGGLLYGLLEVIVDGHFETIESMDDAFEELEEGLFAANGDMREVQQRIYRGRKELVDLRRAVLPMREVINTIDHDPLGGGTPDSELDRLYDELALHIARAGEWTESLRDLVMTMYETSVSLADNRLNTIMKRLTAWAAIIAVPTAVTGWFGQNVSYPGNGHPSGLIASTAVIAILAIPLFVLFKKKKWI